MENTQKNRLPKLSIVTPAYNEGKNLSGLYDRLKKNIGPLGISWEWIVVDDHSNDNTYSVVAAMAQKDGRVRGIRLSRNFGSHLSIIGGLRFARGRAAIFLAADLQDPPELIRDLLAKWKKGAHVVWCIRKNRKNESIISRALAYSYYLLMRNFAGLKEMPPTGADFFLLDRKVLAALRGFGEKNPSLFALISWMGFKQETIIYDRQRRSFGRSKWTLKKKLKLVFDSVAAVSYAPMRLAFWLGLLLSLVGLMVLGFSFYLKKGFWGGVLVFLFGIELAMLGIIGEYLWRVLDESRQRPPIFIEEMTRRHPRKPNHRGKD